MKYLLFFLAFYSISAFAQEDLLKMLQSETTSDNEKVIATFKGNKIINIETNETVKRNNLDFRVSHLFGNIGKESGGGIHNLYGLHQSADIRIGFHYGITDKLMVGISSLKRNENFEGLAKYRVFEQTSDSRIPFALTLYTNSAYSIKESELFAKSIYRLAYSAQAIFARKFSSDFSIAIIPGIVHRNFVSADDENGVITLSGGFRYKFTRSASFIGDYCHSFGRKNLLLPRYDVIGAGLEIETGGHVFSIMFTNASGVLESDYLVNTMDRWGSGGFKLSFIISRTFSLGNDKK